MEETRRLLNTSGKLLFFIKGNETTEINILAIRRRKINSNCFNSYNLYWTYDLKFRKEMTF